MVGRPRPARGRGHRPGPGRGRWVVTDRFSASTLAYQGYGRGLDPRRAARPGRLGQRRAGPRPHRPHRRPRRGGREPLPARSGPTAIEEAEPAFRQRVADGYRRLAADDPAAGPSSTAPARSRRWPAAVWSAVATRWTSPMTDAPTTDAVRAGARARGRSCPPSGSSPRWSASRRAVAQLVAAAAPAGARLPVARAAGLGQAGGGRGLRRRAALPVGRMWRVQRRAAGSWPACIPT